jgi:ABC-type lipoprotein export system ATPase subunit
MEQEATPPLEQQEEKSILKVRAISKAYKIPKGKVGVLQHIDFDVKKGEFIAITGSSGSGKTTLLMLLGALDVPDEGEIWLDDVAVHNVRGVAAADFRREKVGFVFQLFYLLPNMTALENVMAPLLPYRRKQTFDLKERAQELLVRVGLGGRLSHTPARLSGGEQQRVAIARALINQPRVLLADEPTGNLDTTTGGEVLQVLRELQESGNQTLIMVTHDREIARLADRQIQLGELQQKKA